MPDKNKLTSASYNGKIDTVKEWISQGAPLDDSENAKWT